MNRKEKMETTDTFTEGKRKIGQQTRENFITFLFHHLFFTILFHFVKEHEKKISLWDFIPSLDDGITCWVNQRKVRKGKI